MWKRCSRTSTTTRLQLADRRARAARLSGCGARQGGVATLLDNGLALLPDLHFDVIGVYRGESTLVINYRNHRGELVNEVLTFDGALVRVGHGTYLGS
jgi:hypothetical protein